MSDAVKNTGRAGMGRPKGRWEIAPYARKYGKECIDTMVDCMRGLDDGKWRLPAAIALLDRGYGKSKQDLSVEDAQSLTFLHLIAARAFSEELQRTLAIEGSVVADETNGTTIDMPIDMSQPAKE